MNHIKWPEITSFHNVRKLLMTYPELLGSVLEVSYRAKVKLHGCLEQGTRIAYPNGVKKKICEVKVGDIILGMSNDGQIVHTKVLNKFNNGKGDNWLNIRGTREGRGPNEFSIVCTDQHRFFSSDKNEYVRAEDLLVGNHVIMLRNNYSMTPIQEQILLGKLLGDASIRNHSFVSSLIEFSHIKDNKEYFDFTCEHLGSICKFSGEYKSGYGSDMLRARTISSSLIKDIFSSFICDDKKIVPQWVVDKLTPISLAFWYMDDGSLAFNESQEDRANFAVCDFTEDDCKILLQALKKFDINGVYYISDNKTGKEYSRIRLNADEAEKLFLLIAPYIPPCMQYKLPERYRGCKGWLPKFGEEYKPILNIQKITSIEKLGQIDSSKYDLETDIHSYIANGIVVHNSNAAVQITQDGTVIAQSRTAIITPISDNAGFARWVETNKNHWLKNRPLDREVIVFGEWCGPGVQKGVAINQVPNKVFAVFAAQDLNDQEKLIVEPKELEALTRDVPDVHVLPWHGEPVTVAWLNEAEKLQVIVEEINSRVALVEQCDPWVKSVFGVEGLGEGLVYYPLSHLGRKSFSDLSFKAKGEKHKTVNVKAPAQVNPEAASSAAAFAELVLTEARLEQGARAITSNGDLVFDVKTMGKFLGWVGQDVSKECQAELEASNLEWKTASKAVNDKARVWYLNRCKTL